jgi:hypothetical protein
MASLRKVLDAVLTGRSDGNIRFESVRRLLRAIGFSERVSGDHHIFSHPRVVEIVNIQPLRGGKAKNYQVKQVRQIISKYALELGDNA